MSAEVKSMKEWALYYAELGLAVFPLAYRNKVPAIEGGCKAATTEKSKIERWWNQNPRYNIGIATGNKSNGLVVIDLDVDKNKGIDGYEVLRDWQNKHGELPETWQSITGRGGYHYFYKDTITHSNKVGLYEGVDIRGEGGYIVAPPSVHPKVEEYRQKNSRLVQVMQNLQKAAARVGMVVKNMGSALRRAGSAIKSMVSAMKKAVENMFNLNKQTDRSRMSLSRMLGMSLLFSGVSRAISAVSDGVKSGFENLAQYSNSTNSAISSLMSSMTRLKNSFATAFAPVLTVVAPIMSRFIDMISRAITYVGMFVAALTGQNSFVKAVGVQEDYAAGLEKTSKNTNQAAKNTKKANKETEGYLSTLDEIQRYTSNKNDDSVADGNSIGDTGGYTAPTPAQMFKKVPVANSIKGIADKIKKLIKSEDWEGLGKYIASGINKGLKKVYEAISWKKVGPKITKFCDAFTRTFNSLVDNVDWKLLGRTVGAGINTIVNTLNLLITGIDWKNLGKKFAEGITGLVKEVNWNNLGQLIANRFMITWDIFNGMVHNLPFSEIGKAIADGLNGICSRISFREIADTLATGLNGAFTTLYSFTRRFDWTGLVNNIAGGINTFISEFDWKNNGRKLEVFLNSLCSSLVDMAEKTDWEALGQGIGEMLGQINWVKHLKQVITAITRTLGGLFDVLEASGTAGKIAAFLGKAFIAVKIADITGIGSLVKFLVTTIGKKLITEESVQALAGNISNLTNSALAGSTSGIATFASSLGSLVGTAGAITLVTAGTVMLTKKIAELVETAQGGNGILTQTGGYLHDYAGKMGEAHAITNKQVEELWALVEADETAGKSNSEMYDSIQAAETRLRWHRIIPCHAESVAGEIQGGIQCLQEKQLMRIMDFQKMKIRDWVNFARILRCVTRYCCCSAQRRCIRTLLTNYTAVS